jgi:hypothetical protein
MPHFGYLHSNATVNQLRSLYSYWIQHILFSEKLAIFGSNYSELDRHDMKGIGY